MLLPKRATDALRAHRQRQIAERLATAPAWKDQDLVFPNGTGEPLDPGNGSTEFKRNLARLGLPTIRFHDLRHTAATLLLTEGIHPKLVSEMFGHSTIVLTLDTYSHVIPVMHFQAVAAMERIVG